MGCKGKEEGKGGILLTTGLGESICETDQRAVR